MFLVLKKNLVSQGKFRLASLSPNGSVIEVDFEGRSAFFVVNCIAIRILIPLVVSRYKFRITGEGLTAKEKKAARKRVRRDMIPRIGWEVKKQLRGKNVLTTPIILIG